MARRSTKTRKGGNPARKGRAKRSGRAAASTKPKHADKPAAGATPQKKTATQKSKSRRGWWLVLVPLLALGGYGLWRAQETESEIPASPVSPVNQATETSSTVAATPEVMTSEETPPAAQDAIQDANQADQADLAALIAAVAPDQVMVARPPQAPGDAQEQQAPGRDLPFNANAFLRLEQNLQVLALDPGPVDGIIDSRTRAAVRQFQGFMSLEEDGVISPELARDLMAVAAELTGEDGS